MKIEATLPDGRVIEIDTPEGADAAQVRAIVARSIALAGGEQRPGAAVPLTPQTERELGNRGSVLDQVGRAAGLIGRGAVEGVGGLVDLATSPLSAAAQAAGLPPGESVQSFLGRGLTALGVPEPENAGERVFSAAASGAAGGASVLRAGAGLARLPAAASGAPSTAQRVGRALTDQPVRQLVGAGAGGAGAQTAAEGGAGPLTQLGAGLAAGALGARAVPGRVESRFTPQAQAAQAEARRLGFDTRALPARQIEQLQAAVKSRAASQQGEGVVAARREFLAARETARKEAGGLFTRIREGEFGRAFLGADQVRGFAKTVRTTLNSERGFDIANMPKVSRRLRELQMLTAGPSPGTRIRDINIDALQRWRQRVSANAPRDPAERAANTALKREFDRFMQNKFDEDMITGDPSALVAWKTARDRWAAFKEQFDGNATLRKIQDENLTSEQVRRLLFNTSAVGAKAEAGEVVRRLNTVLGPDSPGMRDLRREVLLDIAKPLLAREPSISGFVNNFDAFFRNNATLQRELFGKTAANDLQEIVQLARGVSKRAGAELVNTPGEPIVTRLTNRLLTFTAGNQLARGSARLQVIRGAAEGTRRRLTGGVTEQAILREFLEAEPNVPLFSQGGAAVGAASTLNPDEG